jgi:2-iminobutanoate/2-iminopropanoate deaminase
MKTVIKTLKAPAGKGPFVQAVAYQKLLFTSGQIGQTVALELKAKTIQDQSEQVMNNLREVLEAGNSSMSNVIKTTCYLTDMENFGEFNKVYAKHFDGLPLPARSCVEVSRLPKSREVLVEVEAIAYQNEPKE